jgi:hypothetical protein
MFHLFAKKQFIFPSSKVFNSIPIGHPQFAAKISILSFVKIVKVSLFYSA